MNFLKEGIDCFVPFLFYGTKFATGESDSVHVKVSSLPLSPDLINRKLICSSSLFSFNGAEKYS